MQGDDDSNEFWQKGKKYKINWKTTTDKVKAQTISEMKDASECYEQHHNSKWIF